MTEQPIRKTGILLVNLGSPSFPATQDVRRFLREFLSDPRVVNLPRTLWWLILNLFILPLRPRKSAHAYRSIWTDKGSPLVVFTQQLCDKLNAIYQNPHREFHCAMRYGKPSLKEKLLELETKGLDQLIILPLYPQFSSTTTSSIFDVVAAFYGNRRAMPTLRFISDYHSHPIYIQAIAAKIEQHWQVYGRAELLLMSFHGLPAKLTELGDPYYHHCRKTAELIARQLGLAQQQWQLVFQSRFGKATWLKPYCVDILQDLPKHGIHKIDVVCPGFAMDCLETLEEIAITNKEIFIAAGGKSYLYIPALNADDAHAELIMALI